MAVNKLDISMMEDVGTSANQLLQRDGSGNLPAIDGSLITSLPVDYTVATTDPPVTTNPSATGAVWFNKVDGEGFVCTDNTAGANVWKNFGAGSGDIQLFAFQGSSYGFQVGGSPSPANIYKFSLTSDSNAVDTNADLTVGAQQKACARSSAYSFNMGGHPYMNVVDRFAFVSTANAVDVGDISESVRWAAAGSTADYGYRAGGETTPAPYSNTIERFAYSATISISDVGDLTAQKWKSQGNTSTTHGYVNGGRRSPAPNPSSEIEKYAFASSGGGSDVGDLTEPHSEHASASSTTHGYSAGGATSPYSDVIDRFAFSNETTSTDWGDLTETIGWTTGVSSTTHGYVLGGTRGVGGLSNRIDKYPFASNAGATDPADLGYGLNSACGIQH